MTIDQAIELHDIRFTALHEALRHADRNLDATLARMLANALVVETAIYWELREMKETT